jgi:nucleoside-diphosphate-sugar epimerase
MIVAITGANGFIGKHLVRRFRDRDWEVREVVRADFDGDRLQALFRDASAVVHSAGATRAPTIKQLRDSNVVVTQRVVEAAGVAGVDRLLYVSSLAAIGPAPSRDKPVSDTTQASPIEPYGQSKLDAEGIVRGSGIPFTIVRPAAVYGPSDRDFLQLFRAAKHGLAVHAGNRSQWFSIIHVSDLVDAIARMAETDEAARRSYCLGNEAPVQWGGLFPLAAKCAGRELRLDIELPGWLVDAGALVGNVIAKISGKASLLTSGKVALAKPSAWVCSSTRARIELGLGPETPLERGFCETYRWYAEQGWL